MLSTRSLLSIGLAAILVTCTGCPPKPPPPPIVEQPTDYNWAPPEGEMALFKLTDPSQFPDFSQGYDHKSGLEQAAMYSLDYLSKPSSELFFPYLDVTHERAVNSLKAFRDVLKSATSPQDLDARIKERFDIYMSRGAEDKRIVLFTGYYRPIFDARLQPDGEFRYPLHKRPSELVYNPATSGYQRQDGSPYHTRGEIAQGALNGKNLELCYLRDPFEAYIVTVQGSGKLRLADGSFFEIGYAGDNGLDYESVGQELVRRNLIRPEDLSLQGLIAFFQRHPEHLDLLNLNKRYIFFTPRTGGPWGSLNVPVTPYYSIATDKTIYPRACVAFMQTKLPAHDGSGAIRDYAYSGFALDQDRGNAIRAAGRCDVFLGTGPEVGQLAGRTYAEGKLYYIFVKEPARQDRSPQ
ncbi:MAG: MltA domain-containing protein [Planctomycetes bacterium]|nr:MltA domain-containing protein [Planctomycetota bacterium]